MKSHHCSIRGVTAVALVSLLLGACGGGGGEDAAPAPEVRQLPLDRLSVGAPLNGEARVTVLKETDDDAGPYTATVEPADCAIATVTDTSVAVLGKKLGTCELTIRSAVTTTSIPVEVFDPFVLATDELELAYATDFAPNDAASMFYLSYQPVPKDPSFLALGSVIQSVFGPVYLRAEVVVRPKSGSSAVLPTLEYETQVGVAVHKPVCPTGYRALGWVWTAQKPTFPTACIRNDLTTMGKADRRFSGLFGGTIEGFFVDLPTNPDPHTEHFFAPGTAIGVGPTGGAAEAGYVLKVKLPLVAEAPARSWIPRLSDPLCGFTQRPSLVRSVRIPFLGVPNPNGLSNNQRARESPFYVLERHVTWTKLDCYVNVTDSDVVRTQKYTTGISTSASQTFSSETGVEISAEVGIEFWGASATVGTTLSQTFGYEQTTVVSEFSEHEDTRQWSVVPLKSGALFQETSTFVFYKYVGNEMAFFRSTPAIGRSAFVVTQYPPAR